MADFMNVYPEADIVVWVTPISPFQTGKEVLSVVNYFVANKLDSLITVEEMQVHCNFKNQPVNYNKDEEFSQTQDLIKIHPFRIYVFGLYGQTLHWAMSQALRHCSLALFVLIA